MGLVIELLGPPGAGKTTLAAALRNELAARGRAVEPAVDVTDPATPSATRLLAKLQLVLAAIVTRPVSSLRAIGAIAASRQPDTSTVAHRAVAWLVAQQLVIRARRRPGVTILDEGALQSLWSVGLHGDLHQLLARWRTRPARWRVGDLVVVLLPPLQQLEQRLAARSVPHSRIELLAAEELASALRRAHDLTEEIAATLPQLGLATEAVRRIEDEDALATAAVRRIARHLDDLEPAADAVS